ncbi:MAG: hypothetical protein M1829_000271 [Trizodia sp. TS-e1964]|nr:MAG: hypothetical protein M1829_000271 [Trizodia sp. TS-e1964]
MERLSSKRTSLDMTSETGSYLHNTFEEDTNFDSLIVPDGFRPVSMESDLTPQPLRPTRRESPGLIQPIRPDRTDASPSKRQRISGGRDSFALQQDRFSNGVQQRHDGRSVSPGVSASEAHSTPSRPFSVSSAFTVPSIQSAYHGASGPTHPYAMYPQGTLARSLSVTTTSTIRQPEAVYGGGQGPPLQPYIQYSSNEPNPNTSNYSQSNAFGILVGFPGHAQPYQRRLGPEGEDAQDIIGPDGHTEQLPPYTRYAPGTNREGDALHSVPEGRTLDILDLDISEENLSPQTRRSTRSLSSTSSHARLSTLPLGAHNNRHANEKRFPPITRKWLGIRALHWFLALIFILLLGGICGGVLSRVLHRSATDPGGDYIVTSYTKTSDAIAAPNGPTYPGIPAGEYSLKINANFSSGVCLTNYPARALAWSCEVGGEYLLAEVKPSPQGLKPTLQLYALSNPNNTLLYGAQAPVLSTPQSLSVVQDANAMDLGIAYFFQTLYDKVVIVSTDDLASFTSKRKYKRDEIKKRNNKPGPALDEQFWYCIWNNTLLEGFIYASVDASLSSIYTTSSTTAVWTIIGNSPSTVTSVIPTTVSISTTPLTWSYSTSTEISTQPSYTTSYFSPTQTSSLTPSSTIPTPYSATNGFPATLSSSVPYTDTVGSSASQVNSFRTIYNPPSISSSKEPTSASTTRDNAVNFATSAAGTAGAAGAVAIAGNIVHTTISISNFAIATNIVIKRAEPQPYPNLIKLEESRIPKDGRYTQPYCVRMFFLQNNQTGRAEMQPVMDPANVGNPITFMLNETTPSPYDRLWKRDQMADKYSTKLSERGYADQCLCQWTNNKRVAKRGLKNMFFF